MSTQATILYNGFENNIFRIMPHSAGAKLTHWGQVTHICIHELYIIGSDNGLLPGWCQTIIWTNTGILLIKPRGINVSEILIEINNSITTPVCYFLNI